MSPSLRLYRWLMRLCPESFRARFADEMLEDLAQIIETTRRERGLWAAKLLYIRALFDLLRTAWSEHPVPKTATPSPGTRTDAMTRHFRDAIRQLAAKPGYTVLVILTLATGIGATSAIFETVYAVLLRPPAFSDPEELVIVQETDLVRGSTGDDASPANFADWRAASKSFRGLAAMAMTTVNLTGQGEPEQLQALRVSATFLPVLGIQPERGRVFAPEEDRPDGERVVLLTHGFWQRRFGGRDSVLGETLSLDGNPYRVVGVLPASLRFPNRELDLFTPFAMNADEAQQRSSHYLTVVGRLAPGVSIVNAQEEMTAIAAALERQYPDTNEDNGVAITSLHEHLVTGLEQSLFLLFGAVSALLLLAVVNVANLLLARGSARLREIALRSALGASRSRILVQLMTEALVLSAIGGAAGVLLGHGCVSLMGTLVPLHLERGITGFHPATYVFALVLTAVVAAGIGLMPSLSLTRRGFTSMLRASASSTRATGSMNRIRRALVVCQVALALVLVGLGTVTVRSFVQLSRTDPGFRAENLLTMRVQLSGTRYAEHAARVEFYRELEERISRLPGVSSTGAVSMLPLTGGGGSVGFDIESPLEPPETDPIAVFRGVTASYFRTMGIPLVAGRGFDSRDGPEAPKVVIINRSLSQRFFAGESAIGHHLNIWGERVEIVGMVSDVQQFSFAEEPRPAIYVAAPQRSWGYFDPKEVAIRTRSNPEALIGSIRAEVWAVDPEQPVAAIRTMDTIVVSSLSEDRLRTLLLTSFASAALLLAALGVYGVVSYVVSSSTVEIGVRMALGASGRTVVGWVLSQGLRPVLMGVTIGVALTIALARVLGGYVAIAAPGQPWVLVISSGVLSFVALAAVLIPAIRATRVDPLRSLRAD